MSTAPLTSADIEQMQRPDSELPPELRHREIIEVRNVSGIGSTAYQIVFGQDFLPYEYGRMLRESEFELTYTRVEYHKNYDGLVGLVDFLLPKRACVTIVVSKDREVMPWLRGDDEE